MEERTLLSSPRTRELVQIPLLAVAVCLGVDGPAFAQTPAVPDAREGTSATARAEARERFDRGVRLFQQGESAGALAEFKRANELVPNPLVVYNMGLVYAAMNRPVEAVDALESFLAQATGTQKAQRRHAEEVRDEQATRIAQLVVRTTAPASIEVDGIQVGQTPLATPIRVASGSHVVGAQAPGYLPTRKEVTLPGQVTQTIDLALQPAASRMAQLWITSTPLGAEILVNGKAVGITPLPASVSVAPGTVEVEARRPGYLRAARTMSLGDGARGDVALVLQEDMSAPAANQALLRILPSEPGVEVSVDGMARPNAAAGLRLPAGRHQLRVTLAGFEPFEKAVDLQAGSDTRLAVVLVPTAETREQYQHAVRTRKVVGWSVLGLGAAVAVGSAIYAFTRFQDVSDSRNYLDSVLANEADPSNACYSYQGPTYQLRGCDSIKADAQSRVDSAELRRNLGFVGAGVGVLVAGVGGYLLLTNGDPNRYRGEVEMPTAQLWFGHGSAGVAMAGRF